LWLRTEHPDAAITTELIRSDDQCAVFKATVQIPGGGSATGHGSETASDFSDYIEKAETKALGRALNALGFGAQFAEGESDDDRRTPSRSTHHSAPSPRGKQAGAPERADLQHFLIDLGFESQTALESVL